MPASLNSPRWLKRLGVGAFIFFTIKGLLWLIIPGVLIAWGVTRESEPAATAGAATGAADPPDAAIVSEAPNAAGDTTHDAH